VRSPIRSLSHPPAPAATGGGDRPANDCCGRSRTHFQSWVPEGLGPEVPENVPPLPPSKAGTLTPASKRGAVQGMLPKSLCTSLSRSLPYSELQASCSTSRAHAAKPIMCITNPQDPPPTQTWPQSLVVSHLRSSSERARFVLLETPRPLFRLAKDTPRPRPLVSPCTLTQGKKEGQDQPSARHREEEGNIWDHLLDEAILEQQTSTKSIEFYVFSVQATQSPI
jgi:hypothetical protein